MNFFFRWGLISFLIYNVFYLCHQEAKYWRVAFNIAIAIMVGVMALSILECTLLQEALDSLGGAYYLLGNFAVHYYVPIKLWYTKPDTKGMTKQITFSLTWLATYFASQQAADVYGCPISNSVIIFASLLCIPLTVLVYIASLKDGTQLVYTKFSWAIEKTAKALQTSALLESSN